MIFNVYFLVDISCILIILKKTTLNKPNPDHLPCCNREHAACCSKLQTVTSSHQTLCGLEMFF